MASRLRKVRRLRGSRTHGWGQVGQHRRTGAKGGSGLAGMHKHKWSYTVKYAPDHFGSNKWHPPNPAVTTKWLNINDLERIVGSANEIDLGALGYGKLLGQGSLVKALTVKVPRASASAVEKIKAAGGKIEIEFEPKPEKKQDEKKTGEGDKRKKSEGKEPPKASTSKDKNPK